MTTSPANFDWSLAQSFLAVLERGSLSAAARTLGQSQPTLGRHVRAMEAALGVELFTRVAQGLVPTDAAHDLAPHARAMAEAAARLDLAAAGQAGTLTGTVRITASVIVSHFILPEIIARLRRSQPDIQIELVPSDTTENLTFREADIAIRMYRPEQLDVITRRLADRSTGLFAATAYLDRVGRPRTLDELSRLEILGFDKSDIILRAVRSMGIEADRGFFPIRCDDQAAYWHMICAGCGVGGIQCQIGDAEPKVERIMPEVALPPLPFWLAAPEALRHVPRIRAVWEFLAAELA